MQDVEKHDQVVQATYTLDREDIEAVEKVFGPECLMDDPPTVTLTKGYSNEVKFDGLNVDDKSALNHLIDTAGLPEQLAKRLRESQTDDDMVKMAQGGPAGRGQCSNLCRPLKTFQSMD